jgi:TonB family protein
MKINRYIRRLLPASMVFFFLVGPTMAMRLAVNRFAGARYLQESGAGAPLGKLSVPAEKMASMCITMVSPIYPKIAGDTQKTSTVVVRAVIWKSGSVSPMRMVSGQPALQAAAMNAVRLWRYKPFTQDGAAIDVTTDIQVDFVPGKAGGMVSHPNN